MPSNLCNFPESRTSSEQQWAWNDTRLMITPQSQALAQGLQGMATSRGHFLNTERKYNMIKRIVNRTGIVALTEININKFDVPGETPISIENRGNKWMFN